MKVHIEAWAKRFRTHAREKVTDATFTFVAVDDSGRPRPVSQGADWRLRGIDATNVAVPIPGRRR